MATRYKTRVMSISFSDPAALSHEQVETGMTLAPRFDANGLVTAVTCDAETNEVLMLAHMNAEALRLTLETGFAHYYSRSRKSLWKKGETSGEVQEIVEIRIDCDQDAVLLRVRQMGRGAACHTGRKSCFFRSVEVSEGAATLIDNGSPQLFDPKKVY